MGSLALLVADADLKFGTDECGDEVEDSVDDK